MTPIIEAAQTLFTLHHMFFLFLGVSIGLIVGLLPGLGGIAGLSLVLPFMFGMDPGPALALMVGVTAVTATSDTFPSVLMGIPGTSASQATVMDGFPLAVKGEAARALAAAFTASMLGGVFGALVLTGAFFIAKPLILSIGFGEQLLLIILGLTTVGMLAGESWAKGLASCGLGLLVGAIGVSFNTGQMRLGFDILYLTDGVPLVVIGLGLFAIPEIVGLLRRGGSIASEGRLGEGWIRGIKDTLRHIWIVLRCSAFGSIIGALPGLGGSVVDWIAYGHVVQSSKDKSQFGKGDIRGVIAPESSNNAKEGGALVPTLLFGIPGSGTMALFLGGMLIIGIIPGPSFARDNQDLAFIIIWSIAIANVMGTGICLGLARPIAMLTTIRFRLIAPFMFSLIFFAAFQATRDWGDLIALVMMAGVGMWFKRFGWSRPAFLIGFVLSGQFEALLYQTYQAYGLTFLERPIALILLVIVAITLFVAMRSKPVKKDEAERVVHRRERILPQFLFAGVLFALPVWAIVDSIGRPFSMTLFPTSIAVVTLLILATVVVQLTAAKDQSPVLYDQEQLHIRSETPVQPGWIQVAWLSGSVLLAYLIGFVAAFGGFVFAFLMVEARIAWWRAAAGALATVGVLMGLGHALVLRYPEGLLHKAGFLPWPF